MLEQWVTDAGHHQAKMKSIPCGEDSDQEEELDTQLKNARVLSTYYTAFLERL